MFKFERFSVKYSYLGITIGLLLIVINETIHFFIAQGSVNNYYSNWFLFSTSILLGIIGWYIGNTTDNRINIHQIETAQARKNNLLIQQLYENTILGNVDQDLSDIALGDEVNQSLDRLRMDIKKRKDQETQRVWVSNGIAVFSDLLRSNNHELNALCDNILSNLVRYLKANQAAIFLVDDSEEVLNLVACYAYERKKYLNRKIQFGEGLVGQTYLEKNRLWLKDIPNDYLNITSGLGRANPNNLLLLPLKIDVKVYGVIEIGSFKFFEDQDFELLDKISEMIASTIFNIRSGENTKKMLIESQELTEVLRAQEEEMRQNMEELAATQEDTIRKEQELQKILVELREKDIMQRMTEMSITIKSAIESAKKELNFLRHTPPVAGILRAKENNGIDSIDGSTQEVWTNRLEVILENLLVTKEIYKSITFVHSDNKVISEIDFNGEHAIKTSAQPLVQNKHNILREWDQNTVYITQPQIVGENDFYLEMFIPVYFHAKYVGYIALSLLGNPLIHEIIKREDDENKFTLLDNKGSKLYSSIASMNGRSLNGAKEIIILNENENIIIEIVHS